MDRFDGLPAPDGGASFVRGCLAAGCQAIPAMERKTTWERRAPPPSDREGRAVFELRLRLGLFFAASLRYLTHGTCRLRVKGGGAPWHPLRGERLTYRAFLEAQGGTAPSVTWSKTVLDVGQVCVLAQHFFQFRDVALLTFDLAQDVYNHLHPHDPTGLFSIMLSDDGQAREVDVAGVFLEALARAVEQNVLRLNTRVNGHVFITPAVWFLTTPVGLDHVTGIVRRRPHGRWHDFTRLDVFRALLSQGCLADADDKGDGQAARVCIVDSEDWEAPLELKGLPILTGSLPRQSTVSLFDGTITLKEETDDGHDTGQHLRQPHVPAGARTPGRRQAVLPAAPTRPGARPVERHGSRQ